MVYGKNLNSIRLRTHETLSTDFLQVKLGHFISDHDEPSQRRKNGEASKL
jgi:hypothetical protein